MVKGVAQHWSRGTYLSVIVTEDRRSVLGAAVVALLVERCGIVERVEVLHQIFIGGVVSFKSKVVYFNLLSVSSAHLRTITTSGHTNIRATGEKWLRG
jgi:hypothetical protein